MLISFAPVRRDDALVVVKSGDALTINGEAFDFAGLPDGATIPAGVVPCDWIVGPVERIDGVLHLTLILPHGPAPEVWQTHPDPISTAGDGPIDLPSDTVLEHRMDIVQGGFNMVFTTMRWQRPDEVETVFVPDPLPENPITEQEADHVDA